MAVTTTALFLSAEEIDGIAEPEEYVAAVREAYEQRGRGGATRPRTVIRNEEPLGRVNSYTAILPEQGVAGGYMYTSGFSPNGAWFVTPLFDAETGEPLALIDGEPLGARKTGAVGAVGVDALAKEDASTIGIVGSGKQARAQIVAARTVRDIDRVRVYSRTKENREEFASWMEDETGIPTTAVDDSTTAVKDADIVITSTTASDPVFDGRDLSPGTHVTAMGQYHPYKREIDDYTVANATYVSDLRERATSDAGAFLHALHSGAVADNHVHAELGDVVAGNAPGRRSDDEITVFDSGGTAIETVAGANLVYEKARERDLGTPLEFEMS